jgi:hypothetical protein
MQQRRSLLTNVLRKTAASSGARIYVPATSSASAPPPPTSHGKGSIAKEFDDDTVTVRCGAHCVCMTAAVTVFACVSPADGRLPPPGAASVLCAHFHTPQRGSRHNKAVRCPRVDLTHTPRHSDLGISCREVEIPGAFIGAVIGTSRQTLRKLMDLTACHIDVIVGSHYLVFAALICFCFFFAAQICRAATCACSSAKHDRLKR